MSDAPAFNEYGRLTRVMVKHARDAFGSQPRADGEWRDLNFTAAPHYERACGQYDRFVQIIGARGAEVLMLPPAPGVGLDSIYTRDASIVTPRGVVLCGMGKPQREGEPPAQRTALDAWDVDVVGAIAPPGRLEGGDVVWFDRDTVAVGQGYRTNDAGIGQLRSLLGDTVQVMAVPLPHWRGPGDVFHLMSVISPVDADLAVVYSPLMTVPFREYLLGRGIALVEVPDDEFDRMGANVLAIAPRLCVMLSGCSETRKRLEAAGAEVLVYDGDEISLKGGGGPTCLTRPIDRA